MRKVIALDAMGGDVGPSVVIPAAVQILRRFPDLGLTFVGKQEVLFPLLRAQANQYKQQWDIQHASQTVEMDESPGLALRTKKNSSMRVALDLVQKGKAAACVSAGNTGALMVMARFVLKTLPGIDRPAIITSFPTLKGKEVHILDLGANVDSSPEHLYQFAVMGSVLASALGNIENPRVGLLNIGEEAIKGNDLVKKSAELCAASTFIHYIGYVEGDAIFKDMAEVLVCDGFVGNVTLKAVEGAVKMIGRMAKASFQETWWTKLLILPAMPVLKRMLKKIDPESHNGATLLGLNGIVIKSHGSATAKAFSFAIEKAIKEIEKNVPELIKSRVGEALSGEKT